MSTKLFEITKQLDNFLASSANSVLLKETNGISGMSIIEAHIQKRWLDSESSTLTFDYDSETKGKTNCINIVNVSVAERNRRKGLFTDFMELLLEYDYGLYFEECSSFYVRIDKVMNPVLDKFLLKQGYSRTKADNESHYSYFKEVHNKKCSGNLLDEQISFLTNSLKDPQNPLFESFAS